MGKEKAKEPKQKKKKEEEKIDYKKRAEEYLDGWKRCQADFENYKKIQAESQKDMMKYASRNMIMQILPVIDNFYASTSHVPDTHKDDPWVTGIMYIRKQLEDVLKENGVEEIEVREGDNFDPTKHEAIEDRECDGCEKSKKFENKIKRVILKGYKINEKIIRPAKVIVR